MSSCGGGKMLVAVLMEFLEIKNLRFEDLLTTNPLMAQDEGYQTEDR